MAITGQTADVTAFIEKHVDNGQFRLNSFLPMPEELNQTTSPCEPNPELIEKYGADNWYDWKWMNWGTKREAYDGGIEILDDNYVVLRFQTAWTLPDPVFAVMGKMYPDLAFRIECVEEGGFFAGHIDIIDGQVVENLTSDPDEWKQYAIELLGMDFDDED